MLRNRNIAKRKKIFEVIVFRKKTKNKNLFFLGIILFLAFFSRFYNFYDLFFWGMDQEYEALIVKNIIEGKHFPLIGVSASDTGLYLGPLFLYWAVLPFFLFRLNPLGWGVTASFLGVLTVFFLYKLGKKIFSCSTAFFASFFYSISFLPSFYDRRFWNPMPVPLFSLFLGYFLFKILIGKTESLIWFFLFFALSFHIHLSLLIFLPLFFYVFWKKREIFSQKIIFLSLLVFFLIQVPLFLFEFRHNFWQSRVLFNFFLTYITPKKLAFVENGEILVKTLGRYLFVFPPVDFFYESGQCQELSFLQKKPSLASNFLVLGGLSFFVFWNIKKSKGKEKKAGEIILGLYFLTFLFLIFYPKKIFEYYFLYLFPWLSLSLGKTADLLVKKKRGRLFVLTLIFFLVIINSLSFLTAKDSYSYRDKMEAIKFVGEKLKVEDYNLEALGGCPRFGGYQYLFTYFFRQPLHSYMDSYFGWLYFQERKKDYPSAKVVLLSLIDLEESSSAVSRWEEEKLRYFQNYTLLSQAKFGKIGVYLFSPKEKFPSGEKYEKNN